MKTPISSFARKSKSPVFEPMCPCSLSIWNCAAASAVVSGYSPGWNSRPRSSTQTRCPARASREAAIEAP